MLSPFIAFGWCATVEYLLMISASNLQCGNDDGAAIWTLPYLGRVCQWYCVAAQNDLPIHKSSLYPLLFNKWFALLSTTTSVIANLFDLSSVARIPLMKFLHLLWWILLPSSMSCQMCVQEIFFSRAKKYCSVVLLACCVICAPRKFNFKF